MKPDKFIISYFKNFSKKNPNLTASFYANNSKLVDKENENLFKKNEEKIVYFKSLYFALSLKGYKKTNLKSFRSFKIKKNTFIVETKAERIFRKKKKQILHCYYLIVKAKNFFITFASCI